MTDICMAGRKGNKNMAKPILEVVLDDLEMKHRKLPCRNGALYYCKIPSSSCSFDLQCNENGVIRMWRFVGRTTAAKAGTRYEYRNRADLYTAVGVEVTEEGDISFYAEQRIDVNDSNESAHIRVMIIIYMKMIFEIDF